MRQSFDITISPGLFRGKLDICAIPSKSHLHRLLICASLSDKETLIRSAHTEAQDIAATVNCLSALGAEIERVSEGYNVRPLNRDKLPNKCILPCADSGSTLRFMLPVVCALGVSCEFHMSGRLPERPMAHLEKELMRGGIRLWRPSPDVLCCEGQLIAGDFYLPGNISSQYITGMLMALPLLSSDSSLYVSEPIESEGYIDMTLEALKKFGQTFEGNRTHYKIRPKSTLSSPGCISAEGDWSNAAFWLAAGAMPGESARISGLNRESAQGDREICRILKQMGADIRWDGDVLCVSGGQLRGVEIDAANIPDLIPPLSAVASVSEGETVIWNASRLRLKESDRLSSIAAVLKALGANVTENADGLRIHGVKKLTVGAVGSVVDSYGDHRIAMMAAIASTVADGEVTVKGADAVNKSYPGFWEMLLSSK